MCLRTKIQIQGPRGIGTRREIENEVKAGHANFRLSFCGLLLYYIKKVDTVSAHKSGAIDCLC